MTDLLPLAEVLADLRAELVKASEQGAGAGLRFEVGPVEVELAVTVTRQADAKGSASFKVLGWGVEGGASGSRGHENVHRIMLTLTPVFVESDGTRKPGVTLISSSGR